MRAHRRHHRTTPRTSRLLGSLLLVVTACAVTTGAAPAHKTAATPLDRVIPAPASVDPG
ncbi:beta-N-acetylhexosaminidase, partial [Streptomyces sp. SID5789]|nr:beta-N-acetylhexosaminidase [Streptomyces sp. SID5789]